MTRIAGTGLILWLICLTAAAVRADDPEHTKDSLKTVKENLAEKKAVLIDVREESEWKEGHLRDARHVPLSALRKDASAAAKPLDKDTIVYTHCQVGRRAQVAAGILKDLGFDVRPLKAGFPELVKSGFEKADE